MSCSDLQIPQCCGCCQAQGAGDDGGDGNGDGCQCQQNSDAAAATGLRDWDLVEADLRWITLPGCGLQLWTVAVKLLLLEQLLVDGGATYRCADVYPFRVALQICFDRKGSRCASLLVSDAPDCVSCDTRGLQSG
jgi:hypothetical protein